MTYLHSELFSSAVMFVRLFVVFVSAGLASCQAEVVHPSPTGLVSAVYHARDGELCTYLSWRVRTELHPYDQASNKSHSGHAVNITVYTSASPTETIAVSELLFRSQYCIHTIFSQENSLVHTLFLSPAVTGAIWPSSCSQRWWDTSQVCASVRLLYFSAAFQRCVCVCLTD